MKCPRTPGKDSVGRRWTGQGDVQELGRGNLCPPERRRQPLVALVGSSPLAIDGLAEQRKVPMPDGQGADRPTPTVP